MHGPCLHQSNFVCRLFMCHLRRPPTLGPWRCCQIHRRWRTNRCDWELWNKLHGKLGRKVRTHVGASPVRSMIRIRYNQLGFEYTDASLGVDRVRSLPPWQGVNNRGFFGKGRAEVLWLFPWIVPLSHPLQNLHMYFFDRLSWYKYFYAFAHKWGAKPSRALGFADDSLSPNCPFVTPLPELSHVSNYIYKWSDFYYACLLYAAQPIETYMHEISNSNPKPVKNTIISCAPWWYHYR